MTDKVAIYRAENQYPKPEFFIIQNIKGDKSLMLQTSPKVNRKRHLPHYKNSSPMKQCGNRDKLTMYGTSRSCSEWHIYRVKEKPGICLVSQTQCNWHFEQENYLWWETTLNTARCFRYLWFYLLNATITSYSSTASQLSCNKMSLDIAKCPLRGEKCLLSENHW